MERTTAKAGNGGRKVTLKDVAARANVSYATVSRALNNIEDRYISEATRRLVVATAADMGYQPNRQARSLVTRRNMTVGVVFPAIGPDTMLSPFLQHTLNGILNAAEELRQDILLLSAADRNRPDGSPEEVTDSRIDGVIFIAPPDGSPALELAAERGMPHVVLGGKRTPGGIAFNADNVGGVRLAMEHLVGLGHRRIAHIAGLEYQTDGRIRLDAYRRFVEEHRLPVDDRYLRPGNFHMDGGFRGAMELLRLPEPPTAIFCANDGTAFGVLQAATALDVRVPQDLSVVGFDDHSMSAAMQPPLTTVRQPLDAMGAAAIRAIVAVVGGQPPADDRLFPTELVIRSTTARAREHSS
jgi:DNA-binding LacI/PurR family transcriptional regulator